jgi:hypothetical protein
VLEAKDSSRASSAIPSHNTFNAYRINANARDEHELLYTTDLKRRRQLQNRMAVRRLRVRRSSDACAVSDGFGALRKVKTRAGVAAEAAASEAD